MVYTTSQAFSPRGTQLQYLISSSVGYTTIAELESVDFSGRKLDLDDVTNFQSGIFREFLPTLMDSGDLNYKGNFIPGDTTQQQLMVFFNAATLVGWQIVLPNNVSNGKPYGHFLFNGFVTGFDVQMPYDKAATISGKIKITGAINFVAGF